MNMNINFYVWLELQYANERNRTRTVLETRNGQCGKVHAVIFSKSNWPHRIFHARIRNNSVLFSVFKNSFQICENQKFDMKYETL